MRRPRRCGRDSSDISRELPGDVRVVIVRGEGRAFSAGLDLSVARGNGDSSFADLVRVVAGRSAPIGSPSFQERFTWLRRPSLVTMAAVQGHAIGAGFQLALGCDLRVLADDARLSMAEVTLGLVPDLGGTKRLAELVGYCPGAGDLRDRPADRRPPRRTGSAWPPWSCPATELDGAVADLAAAVLAARPGRGRRDQGAARRCARPFVRRAGPGRARGADPPAARPRGPA